MAQLWILAVLLCTLLIQTASAYEFAVVAIFKNEARLLREWVEFHRIAGVDHFWLYNNGSTDSWKETLEPYIEEGLVEVTDWPYFQPEYKWPGIQIEAYKHGITRARGQAHWVALIDIDEFILPLMDKTIPECLTKHFPEADAIYVNWKNFGTSYITVPKDGSFLVNLTRCSLPNHPNNAIGKSIVQPEKVSVEDIWYVHHCPLLPGFHYVNGDNLPMKSTEKDLYPDGKHHGKFLRINHYTLRDEEGFQKLRTKEKNENKRRDFMEHYEPFSLAKDTKILKYLMKSHPEKCQEIWSIDPQTQRSS
jgi:hypothetical protein